MNKDIVDEAQEIITKIKDDKKKRAKYSEDKSNSQIAFRH